jgi:hypothetical protein
VAVDDDDIERLRLLFAGFEGNEAKKQDHEQKHRLPTGEDRLEEISSRRHTAS